MEASHMNTVSKFNKHANLRVISSASITKPFHVTAFE